MSPLLADMLAIANLVLKLREVERATKHADGRPETVTTHTVMLALCCMPAIVELHGDPEDDTNMSKVLLYALAHDIVEAYAGDTDTSRILDADAAAAKDAREAAALERIRAELPGLASVIDAYERQDTVEARLVRTMDKVMPKLVAMATDGVSLHGKYSSVEHLRQRLEIQGHELLAASPDLMAVHELFDETSAACIELYERGAE